jgi:hypothetical protein
MNRKGGQMNRRSFLGAMGLVAGATRGARAASTAPLPTGANFLYFHTPNGFYRPSFGADPTAGGLTLRPSLAPLQPWAARLAVVAGLSNRASGGPPISRLLTCTSGAEGGRGYGSSIDTVLGNLTGTRPLNLAVTNPGEGTRLSWSRGLENTPTSDVVQAWDRVFGPGTISVDQAVKRAAHLDKVLSQRFARIDRGLPMAEVGRLSEHAAYIHPIRSPGGTGLLDRASFAARAGAADLREQGRTLIDLALTAFAAGFRRAATIVWQPAGAGIDPTGSARSHAEIAASGDGEAQSRIDAWYAAEFAHVLEQLTAMKLLDTTVVCWGSEVSQGASQNNMTFVLAGGAALRVRNAVAVNLPFVGKESDGVAAARMSANRPVADLWLTVLRAFGAVDEGFGDPGRSEGPISALLTTP